MTIRDSFELTEKGKSLFDVGMEHLMRMDRVKAIESARAYNRLSEQIREFLQGFKDSGEVVTEKDIKQFFAVSHAYHSQR